MSEQQPDSAAPKPSEEAARCPECDTPVHLRDRLHRIAARLRDIGDDLGGEVMVDIPSRFGDHSGLIIALANELEMLVK